MINNVCRTNLCKIIIIDLITRSKIREEIILGQILGLKGSLVK